jgi:hypothetical protein
MRASLAGGSDRRMTISGVFATAEASGRCPLLAQLSYCIDVCKLVHTACS